MSSATGVPPFAPSQLDIFTGHGKKLDVPRTKKPIVGARETFVKYQKQVADKIVRPFGLDENEDTFAQLEALRKLIAHAEAGMIIFGAKTLSAEPPPTPSAGAYPLGVGDARKGG